MSNDNYPKPPSHKTFQLDSVCISSDFDSGNCSNAERAGNNHYHLWIGTDNPKNNYRTWFHFSVTGAAKGATLSFTIKNMQNQSRLLNEGLVPVYREESSGEWKRVGIKVDTSAIEFNEGWIQWTFKHNFKTAEKHYFAFFYPWSNDENSEMLDRIQEQIKNVPNAYFYRKTIIRSIEGRPVQFLVISSHKNRLTKEDSLNDPHLLKDQKAPCQFGNHKPGVVISARVHPGQVPSSHVMTGIIQALSQNSQIGRLLRDEFVFYIFPILNPDGVGRGHYRVDTNGINLNRCYINPSPKDQPSIYAVKKYIMHLHSQGRFFAFLDLHAHAARKGTFIYGNCSNQLMQQVNACIFPKLLSMNSIDFEYEGSNFTEKNMYCKDRGDHISKEGSGRVAMFKATRNAYCWTLECNYNISRINNVLEARRQGQPSKNEVNQNNLDQKLIIQYRQPPQIEAKQFFTIETYRKLGYEICETFLDLIQKNPQSRIDNPSGYFKSVANVKMNLAVALLRMAPNRFESNFKKIYSGLSASQNEQIIRNSLKALYFLVVKNAKIANINNYVKTGDASEVNLPQTKKAQRRLSKASSFRTRDTRYNSMQSKNQLSSNAGTLDDYKEEQKGQAEMITHSEGLIEVKSEVQDQSQNQMPNESEVNEGCYLQILNSEDETSKQSYTQKRLQPFNERESISRITLKLEQFKMIRVSHKKSLLGQPDPKQSANLSAHKHLLIRSEQAKAQSRLQIQELPFIGHQKYRMDSRRAKIQMKGPALKDQYLFVS